MISPTRLRVRILAFTLFVLFLNTYALFHNLPQALSGEVDFRSLYAAGTIVRTHHAPRLYDYDLERITQNTLISSHPGALPFLYPAYAALPFVPLSALHYRTAYLTFLALNLALLLAAARVLARTFQRQRLTLPQNSRPRFSDHHRTPLLTLLFLAFLPVSIAFYQGQVSLILLLCFCAAYVALTNEKPFAAGLLLSLALIKFHVVLPVVLLYLFWRKWPLIQGFAAGATALALTCLAIQGPQGIHLYLQTLLNATSMGAIGTQNPYTVFSVKMPNLHGLCFFLLGPSHWTTPLVLLTSAAVLLWTALQPPSLPRAMVAGLLVSYHLHMHDLTLLLLPITLVLHEALNAYQSRTPQPHRIRTVASLLWLTSPITLYLIATGANGLLAPAMLPFLLATKEGRPILSEG